MKKTNPRLVIYHKDVMNLTGRSERVAYKLLAQIRKANGKPKGSFVTIAEFCKHTGLDDEEVKRYLNA